MSRRARLLFVVLAALAVAEPLAAQCAMCRSVIEGSVEGKRILMGLNRGILLMFMAPYAIFGGFCAVVFRDRLGAALTRWRAARSGPGVSLAARPLPAGD